MINQNIEVDFDDTEHICWRAIPIQYDNYPKVSADKYDGEFFGHLAMFESPHYLYRRFHKNYCKAYAISNLSKYTINKDFKNEIIEEVKERFTTDIDLQILSFHHSLVFLVSGFEAFIKDVFAECLKVTPDKLANSGFEKKVRKFNFQNIESINQAFQWLFENNTKFIDDGIDEGLKKRHKIIHESYYDEHFTKQELDNYFLKFLIAVDGVHFYLEDNDYYKLLNPKAGENINK